VEPAESLAIFRDFRRRTNNQKLSSIFYKLRNDAQRNDDIGGTSTSLVHDESNAQNNSASLNDTIPKPTSSNSSGNQRHRSRSCNHSRNRSWSGQRNRSLSSQRNHANDVVKTKDTRSNNVSFGPPTLVQQSRVHTNKTWVNRAANSSIQSNVANQFASRSNITIANRTSNANHNRDRRNSNRNANYSFRNYADYYPIESDSDDGPSPYYYGPNAHYQPRK
jgi:hypothetical protein